MGNELLVTSLLAAVPLHYQELGLPDRLPEYVSECGKMAELLATKGDILQFGGGKKGEAAEVFNALARGLAILSALPGGVDVFGFKWVDGCGTKVQ